jgi:hypothetical protein
MSPLVYKIIYKVITPLFETLFNNPQRHDPHVELPQTIALMMSYYCMCLTVFDPA